METPQRFLVLRARATEADDAARDDRPIAARRIELVQRLNEERRLEPLAASPLAAEGDHVGRSVAAVDIQSGAQPGNQEPARPAAGVERRLSVLDEAAKIVDLLDPRA